MRRFVQQKKIWIRFHLLEPYFCLFSRFFLARWQPDVTVITGSVGKTNLLHLLTMQFGDDFAYSYRSNSKIGITLNMLSIEPVAPGKRWRWLFLLVLVPLKAFFSKVPQETKYLVEYDAFDPTSSDYFKWWLRPRFVVWLTVSQSHIEQFDKKAKSKKKTPMECVVEEFKSITVSASELIFAPRKNDVIKQALQDAQTPVQWVDDVVDYSVDLKETVFRLAGKRFAFSHPLPEQMGPTLSLMNALVDQLGYDVKQDLRAWQPPPGRNTLLRGYKGCHLIDSSYNAQLESFLAMIDMLKKMTVSQKWLVCGDMLEQGTFIAQGHEQLARELIDCKADRLFLVGPRTEKYVCPILSQANVAFDHVRTIDRNFLELIKREIRGGEIILLKGAGFLGTLAEALLANKSDRQFLDLPGRYMHMLK